MDTKTVKLKLIYPKWKKLPGQTTFNLPPHGPVAFAATLPWYVDISFTDENVEDINFDEPCDLVALSMMLSTQVKRGWEIAEEYHKRGKQVIAGGISTMLHAEEMVNHVDSVFLGEAEGRSEEMIQDWKNGCLKKTYNYIFKKDSGVTFIFNKNYRVLYNLDKYNSEIDIITRLRELGVEYEDIFKYVSKSLFQIRTQS